jgi:hypothetical protein
VAKPGDSLELGFHIFSGDDSNGPPPPGAPARVIKWFPQAYTGAWVRPDQQEPPPGPVTDYGCPAPRPERLWTAETLPPGWDSNLIGTGRFHLQSGPHGAWVDSTALTLRNVGYSEAIGMSPTADGVIRDSTPMRPEGPTRVDECAGYVPGPYGLTLDQCLAARRGENRVE